MAKDKASGGGGSSQPRGEAAAVKSYVGSAKKANAGSGTNPVKEQSGSHAQKVNSYVGNALRNEIRNKNLQSTTKSTTGEGRAERRNESKGGSQIQYAQEASQGQQSQQAEAQESKFSDEANKGQSQNAEQQEQNKYSREANEEKAGYTPEGNYYDPEADAAFVDLFAKDEGKGDDPAKTLADAASGQTQTEGDDAQKGSAWAKQRAEEASEELAKLQEDQLRARTLFESSLAEGEVPSEETLKTLGLKNPDEYDDEIERASREADYFKKLAETGATDTERNELLEQYNAANDTFETYAGYATDPLTAAAMGGQEERVEDLEGQLKEKNRELGNTSYTGLADYARGKDFVENWQGERGAQYGAALGTAAEWLGDKINNTSYTVTDPDTGEEREVWNLAGKGDALKEWGSDVFQSSKALNQEAQQDWADVTEGMSAGEQQALGIAKTFGNTAEDAVVNLMTLGLGGKALMGARAAGSGALTQDERDANDLDSRMTKAILDGGVAYLSEWLVGGAEGAYGKSVLGGKITDSLGKVITNPTMRKILFNTEGLEEGLEYALGYMGDRMLELDPNAEWSRSELAQNVAVGYLMGLVFNGLSDAKEITGPQLRAKVDESLDTTQQVVEGKVNLPEVMEKTMRTPSEDVVIKPGKADANVEAEAETSAPEAEAFTDADQQRVDNAVEQAVSEQRTPGQQAVADTLLHPTGENGRLANSQVDRILNNPQMYQDFLAVTGLTDADIRASTASQTRTNVKEAAAKFQQDEATRAEARDRARAYRSSDLEGSSDVDDIINEVRGWDSEGEPEGEGDISPEAEGNPETEAPQTDEAATLAETAENGTATETPENEANTLAETAEGQGGVNAPGTTENAAEGNSEASGGSVEGNPLVTAAEGNQNAGDQTAGQAGTEGTAEGTTAEGTQPNGQGARSAEGTGPERTSQFYENTLTKDEGTKVREPLTYLGKSDYDTLRGAMDRLNLNGEAETSALMTSEMWNDEQVATARIVRQSLFDDANRTGDWTAYDSWRKICDEHHRVIARALRQVGINNNVSAESVASMAHALLDGIEQDINERGTSQTAGRVKPEEVAQVRQQVDESIQTMSALEAEEAELRNSGLSEEEAWTQMKDKYLDACQKVVAERNMGLLWDDLLGRNKAIRAGKADVDTKLKSMLAKEDPEYIRNYLRANVSGQAADVVYKGRPTVKQAANFVSSLQKLCQLFGSGTSLRNVEGNAVFGAIDWASNQTGGVIVDSFLSLLTGNRTRGFESGLFNKANRDAVTKASRRSVLEIAANMDMREDGKYLSGNTAFSPYNAGTRWLARLNQALSYALNTSDAASVGLNEASASSAALRAGQRSGMTEETAQRIGQQEAEFRTFKDKNAVTEMLTRVQQTADLIGFGGEFQRNKNGTVIGRKGGFGLGTAIQPYIGVPANIGLKIAQYSPIGAVKGAVDATRAVSQSRNAAKGSQAAQDAMVLQNKAAGEIGRGITGTALILLLKGAFKKAKDEGEEIFHDWDLETDPDIKAQNRAEGKFGQQLNIDQFLRNVRGEDGATVQQGDRMIDISGIEPLNQFITMASIMSDDENASTLDSYFGALATGAEETLTDLPCLQAIGSFVDTYNNAKIYDTEVTVDAEGNETEERVENKRKTAANALGATAGSVASGFVPAPVRHLAQVTDEKQRDTTAETSSGRAVNQLKMAIPGLRETLPAKTDAYGNEVTQGDAATRAANTYLGNKYSQVNQSDVSREVERIRESTGVDLTPDRYGPKTFTYGSGKDKETVRVTNEESTDLKNQRGQEFESAMQTLMDDPVYQLADDDTKQALANAARLYGNDTLKTEVAEKNGIEYDSRYAEYRELDDPVEVLAAQTSYSAAKKAEDWDAVDELLKTIRRGDGKISQEGMDYMISKDSKINYYTYLADKGVPTRRAKEFDADMEELYTSEKREAPRSTDYLRTATSGKYSSREADAIMSYERDVSAESLDRYQSQIQYQLQQAGKTGMYSTIADWAEDIQAGDKTMDDFRSWVRNEKKSGIPLKQANEIADVLSTWTSDRHAAGKTVAGIYEAARSVGYTPEQVGTFFEHLDTNYNGSYSKSEIDAAVAWALGYDKTYTKRYYGNTYRYYTFSGAAKKLRDGIRERIGK